MTFNSTLPNEGTLMDAMYRNDITAAAALIGNGLDIHEKDKFGDTYLMWAVRYNRPEIARLLLDHGASLDAKSWDGKTALEIAVIMKRDAIAVMIKDEARARFARRVQKLKASKKKGPSPR